MIAATVAVLVVASLAATAHVGAPARLHPGSVVYVHISGYPPGSRVRSNWPRDARSTPTAVSPSLTRACKPLAPPSTKTGPQRSAGAVLTQYAQCVSSICSSPKYKRFRRGESVLVDVSTTDDTAFADSTARIT